MADTNNINTKMPIETISIATIFSSTIVLFDDDSTLNNQFRFLLFMMRY